MKKTRMVSVGIAFVLAITFSLHAQTTTISIQSLRSASADDLAMMRQALEETTPLPAESVPRGATFWSAKNINFPPLPSNINNLPAWNLGGGNWLLADQDFDYAALEQQNAAMHMLSRAMGLEMDSQDITGSSYTIDTNGLWLEIAGVSNGVAWFNLHNSTNQIYAILSTTDLLANWNMAAEVWPTNSEVMPFTVPTLERQSLFLRAEDWTGVDSDGDGIPDWWIWKYFGDLSENATNLDSQGNTLLDDYQNVVDPNVIQFSLPFTNYYVNTLNVPVQLNISGGVPSYMAVLINDMNQDDAVWQPYTASNIVVTLGSTNGAYGIFVGLRGLPPDATQTWRWASVTLYSVAPLLTITSPATSMISQSPIQLRGYSSQPLDSLTFDVSNAAGVFTNQPGFLTGQFYDTDLLAYTTNYFECSDIVLNDGTNVITLHATDWAGNTTSVSFTLDYSPDTNPPVLNLVWPQDGTAISGSQFTLEAQVSDPTTTVTASINGNTVQGLVEQNGSVWVQNLSLNAGTNAVTLTVSNAVGGVSVTNFNVIENDVGLVINPLTSDQMNQPSVTVTGFIGDPVDDCVFVNGVQATVYDDGFWEADGVPVNPTGTASLYVQVYIGDPVLIASQKADKPQPAMVVLAGYSGFINTHGFFFASILWPVLNVYTINWAHDSGGNETDTGYTPTDAGLAEGYFNSTDGLPADGPGFATPKLRLVWDYFSVNVPYGDDGGSFQRSYKAQPMIAPSGQQQAGTTNVYLLLVSASEYSNPIQNFGSTPGDLPQPPEWWRYKGETLVNTGITNTYGAVWGATLVSALAGKTPIITLTNTQCYSNKAASLNMQLTNVIKIIDANTFNNVTDQTNAVIVGQQISLFCELTVPIRTNWTFGNFSWTVPGMTFLNYVADAQSGVLYTNIYTNLQNVVFYWADGASNRVIQCSAKVNGQTVTATTTFNVLRPTAKITTTGGTVALDLGTNSYTTLHCGLPQAGFVGMLFSNTVVAPPGYSGNINLEWVQKISSLLRRVQTDDTPPVWYRRQATDVLDVQYPYQLASPDSCTSDSPNSQELSPYQAVSYSDSFEMWLMFKPDGGQWVPLRKVSWHWDGAGSKYGITWTLDSHTDPGNPIDTDTTTYPLWTDNINNHPWQKE